MLCGLIYLFIWRFMDYSPRVEWQLFRRVFRIVGYFAWLVGEILRSAWGVMRLIWSPTLQPEPRLTAFRSGLRTEAGRVVLADSITLTPGTVTVSLQGEELLVHGLDVSMTEGLAGSDMERRIAAVEGVKRDE